jgi:NodT family efflux transporter outer membrane factor (OMF) lipoprotein
LAEPAEAAPKGNWWQLLGDAQLDALIAQALRDNFSLQGALARLDAARAQADQRAALLQPSVQAGATASRTRTSAERPLASYSASNQSTVQNDFRPAVTVSYEFDWLGRLRLDAQAARAAVEQSEADTENLRLLLAAQIAAAYLQLRELDEEQTSLQATLEHQTRVLALIDKRHAAGASSAADLAQQRALIETSRSGLRLLQAQRNHQQAVLATLVGVPAPRFELPAAALPPALPAVPMVLPGRLLERRPDVAAAERAVAVANAQVGVVRAAAYPALSLAPALLGTESRNWATLLDARALVWSFGLSISESIWDGGRNDAAVATARATHAATVAAYRQTVLTAWQEAQDAMGTLQELAQAQRHQDEAVREQARALAISELRYREGLDNAITLTLAQQNLLVAQRAQTQLRGNQFQAAVALIKALGGGWVGADQAAAH